MNQYLIIAENIIFKNDKLTCINIYDRLSAIAMPAEFRFDLAIMCGPKWKVGEHKLSIKAVGSNGKEISIGELAVNIPNEDFVYNAYAINCKVIMDYSVSSLTFVVYDNGKEIISRKYPVTSMIRPKAAVQQPVEEKKAVKKVEKAEKPAKKTTKKKA